jgi:Fe-S oxidoreductase
MTTTYDPADPTYLNEDNFDKELLRVFDLCHGCRLCFNLCPSFPTLFNSIDAHGGDVDKLTKDERDQVVDECYQCKLCYIKCPYIPPHEWDLDFPRLMMRAQAVRMANKADRLTEKIAKKVLAKTDLSGTMATILPGISNALVAKPGTPVRMLMETALGISSKRQLPLYTKQRFSTWWKNRNVKSVESPQDSVALFTTCFVEYMQPSIGKSVVKVLEHNKIRATNPSGIKCCGAPYLHSGDIESFKNSAESNVDRLAIEVAQNRKIIVSQPTCAYIIKEDYPRYLKTDKAETVAANTLDVSEYLISLKNDDTKTLNTEFKGEVPENITYHCACHLRAQMNGYKARDLMKLTGAKIDLVQECSGIDGTWGYRKKNAELAMKVSEPLISKVNSQPESTVTGDCHLANVSINEQSGRQVLHPIEVIARAYGIEDQDKD